MKKKKNYLNPEASILTAPQDILNGGSFEGEDDGFEEETTPGVDTPIIPGTKAYNL